MSKDGGRIGKALTVGGDRLWIHLGEITGEHAGRPRKIAKVVRQKIIQSAIEIWSDPSKLPSRNMAEQVSEEKSDGHVNERIFYVFLCAWMRSNLIIVRSGDIGTMDDLVGRAAFETAWREDFTPAYDGILVEMDTFIPFEGSENEGFDFHFLPRRPDGKPSGTVVTHVGVCHRFGKISTAAIGIAGVHHDNGVGTFVVPGMSHCMLTASQAAHNRQLINLFGPDRGPRYLATKAEDARLAHDWVQRAALNAVYLLSTRLTGRHTVGSRKNTKKRRKNTTWIVPDVWELELPVRSLMATRESAPPHDQKTPSRPSVRSQHVVAGHWREQACGPRHTLRKRTWVPPHWRCKDSKHRKSTVVSTKAGDEKALTEPVRRRKLAP